MLPNVEAAPDALKAVRTLLQRAGYGEASVLARTGAASVAAAFESRPAMPPATPPDTAVDLVHTLFFDELPVDGTVARRILGEAEVDRMLELGLLRMLPSVPGALGATVLLYPVRDLYIASDLSRDPGTPGKPYALANDAVYPAITPNTSDFLSLLPDSPRGRFLDMCAGTGVAALLAARTCAAAFAADVTERATMMATFNARLNGLDNVRAVRGDVWEAVGDETFDRIVAHPPYAPALDRTYVYRDGGEDGERVTRRVLAGVASHLAPGGRFHATCSLTELRDAPVEQRVRAMLGESGDSLDVLVVTSVAHDVAEYHFRMGLHGEMPLDEAERLTRRMRAAGVERIILCTLLIARHDSPRAPITLRRQRGAGTTAAHLERAIAEGAQPAEFTDEWLATLRPRLSPHARLQMTHAPSPAGWSPVGCIISTEAPFRRRMQAGANLARLLGACSGELTAPELYERMVAAGGGGEAADRAAFARAIRQLLDDGYIEAAGVTVPAE